MVASNLSRRFSFYSTPLFFPRDPAATGGGPIFNLAFRGCLSVVAVLPFFGTRLDGRLPAGGLPLYLGPGFLLKSKPSLPSKSGLSIEVLSNPPTESLSFSQGEGWSRFRATSMSYCFLFFAERFLSANSSGVTGLLFLFYLCSVSPPAFFFSPFFRART